MMFGARSTTCTRGLHGNAVDIYESNPLPLGKTQFIGIGAIPAA
jgi:hypothetical protein